MCGITGYFNFENKFNPTLFSKANNIIKHRGPDDFGYISINSSFEVQNWRDENLQDFSSDDVIGAFGFRRLSIIDLSSCGHQPMTDSTETLWIVFNGEIYNYIELRVQLISKGYKFISNSDTEVILNAYAEWGTNCLNKFNGMWAFCLFDKKAKKLFCARDRLGIKPLYYTFQDNSFAFSSEIKQLIELLPNRFTKINKRLVFDFLAMGSYGNESKDTYFEGIVKLNAGCYLEIDLNKSFNNICEQEWWNLQKFNPDIKFDDDEVFEKISYLLEDSIRLRLRSDVPLGTALSGGLDSSGLVCILNKIYKGDSKANKVFTISSNDKSNDDTYYSKLIVDNVPVTSYVQNFEENVNLNELEKFIWHQDEPLQTASIFGSWQLYRFIKEQGITVAIDGQGADELMGGYNKYPFRRYLLDTLRIGGIKYFIEQANKISKVYKKQIPEILLNTTISSILEYAKSVSPRIFYSQKIEKIKPLLNKDFINTQLLMSKIINKGYSSSDYFSGSIIKGESYELTKHTNLPGILRQVDRNSMAFSVESRLPFLDYRLVEFLYSLPVHYMIRNGYTKYAYRMSMKGIIPDEILWRKSKIGFKMPEFEILSKDKSFVKEHLFYSSNDDFIDKRILDKKMDFYLSDKTQYNNIVWRLLCFSIWKREYNLE